MQLAVIADTLCQTRTALKGPNTCNIQTELTDSRCYINSPRNVQWAVIADTLCSIKNLVASGGTSQPFFVLQSDDGLWYQLSAIELLPGVATLSVNQTPVAAGTQPYRVLVNATDMLRYKLRLTTSGGFTGVFVEITPTGEAFTETDFSTVSGDIYKLALITDGSVTWTLTEL